MPGGGPPSGMAYARFEQEFVRCGGKEKEKRAETVAVFYLLPFDKWADSPSSDWLFSEIAPLGDVSLELCWEESRDFPLERTLSSLMAEDLREEKGEMQFKIRRQ